MEPGSALVGAGRGGPDASRSSVQRKAASVLPLPVGAWMRVCRPRAIAAQPSTWACVGAANELSNQARTAGENGARGSPAAAAGSRGGIDTVATGFGSIGRPRQFDHLFESGAAVSWPDLLRDPVRCGAGLRVAHSPSLHLVSIGPPRMGRWTSQLHAGAGDSGPRDRRRSGIPAMWLAEAARSPVGGTSCPPIVAT
jgi:hypothetical protein